MRFREQHGVVLFLLPLLCHLCCVTNMVAATKVDYVRLPLLTVTGDDSEQTATPQTSSFLFTPLVHLNRNPQVVDPASGRKVLLEMAESQQPLRKFEGKPFSTIPVTVTIPKFTNLLENLTRGASDKKEEAEGKNDNNERVSIPAISAIGADEKHVEGDAKQHKTDNQGSSEDDEREDVDKFNEFDLIQLVQDLEYQADLDEQTDIFPEILDILHGKHQDEQSKQPNIPGAATLPSTESLYEHGISNITLYRSGVISRSNDTLRISLNEDGDLQLGSEDLSQFSEEIVDGISEGVEESLRMSDDLDISDNLASGDNATAEMRQFSIYLFQGQYYAEPRLNRFIDGALRNMGTELRVGSMDPLYFRVLPRGHVAEREQPLMGAGASGVRRRRPVAGGGVAIAVGRQLPAFFRLPNIKKNHPVQAVRLQHAREEELAPQQRAKKKKLAFGGLGVTKITNVGGANFFLRRKRQQQQRLQRERQRRQRLRQQQLKQQLKNRLHKQQQNNKNKVKKNNINNTQKLLQRIRRRARQDVGGGRIEGLSRIQRDGDAEMQLFGNYTLIRSHMKMGPVEIIMQFRTKNGIRRSGATLPVIRAHTVTRVNHEGSEMIDYLLDRPHPESIRVRGNMYPLAQRVARNIFARLFLPNSFLVSKLREKAVLAYLSKPAQR